MDAFSAAIGQQGPSFQDIPVAIRIGGQLKVFIVQTLVDRNMIWNIAGI